MITVSVKRAGQAVPLPVVAPCVHGGTDADILERCPTCNGGVRHVRECAVHDRCTWEPVNPAVMDCRRCRAEGLGYEAEGATPNDSQLKPNEVPFSVVGCLLATGIVIDHGAGGIGDGLLGLTAVAQLSADNPGEPVEYRVSATARPFVELFDGCTTVGKHARAHSELPVPGARQMNVGYQAENREKYRRPRWERYAKNIGATGNLIPKLRDPAKVKAVGADLAGCVALLPFSTDRAREWSLHHWLTLEAKLLAAGYHTATLHSEPKALARFKGAKVAGQSAERVAGVLLNACCAVGTDSGLAHLAGILGTPTVVLGGSTPVEKIFGVYPRVVCVQGGLDCSGCCGGTGVAVSGLEDRCRASCANLQSITPERVAYEVDRLAFDGITQGRTLISPDRLAVVRDCVRATNHLPGELAEAGSYRGGSAKLISHYSEGGTLHVFDALGIPADDTARGGVHKAGEFAGDERELREFLAGQSIALHLGVFPETTCELPTDVRYRFVHLDLDTEESTRAALLYFWSRLVPGGIMILDDLDWKNCPGVRLACNEVLPPDVEIESPARHQGVIRKPQPLLSD